MKSSYIYVEQSPSLSGTVIVEGAKNSILPIAIAAILSEGCSVLHNVGDIKDVRSLIALLEAYGAEITYDPHKKVLIIDGARIRNVMVPYALFRAYRASSLIAGALLARFGEVWLGFPGGDSIGKRPITIHLKAFEKMGAIVTHHEEYIHLYTKKLSGAKIFLEYPSVGATQNVLLAAAGIPEKTVIMNAAQEPEVTDLVEALKNMGATITCRFPSIIEVEGKKKLLPFNHTVIPDRLEAATLLIAAAITRGNIFIANAPAFCMHNLLSTLEEMGYEIQVGEQEWGVSLFSQEYSKATSIKTMPYPGFSTDLQSPMMALLAIAQGVSTIHETVFESRMSHAFEMNKMGADITVEYDYAKIRGVETLYGSELYAQDIRACASLVIAALAAKGISKIHGVAYLKRGYENIDEKLRSIGAHIRIISDEVTPDRPSVLPLISEKEILLEPLPNPL